MDNTLRHSLNSRNCNISLNYYGIQDLATGWEAKNIIDNWDIFNNLYSDYPLTKLCNMDDYYLFLLSSKFMRMEEIIPFLLHDEHKCIIASLVENAKKAISSIGIGDITRFINAHYKDIFCDNEAFDMKSSSLDLIAKYNNGISLDVFEYLSCHYGFMLINRFDQFEKTFERYPKLFDSIYPSGHLVEVDSVGIDKTLEIWHHLINKQRSNLKESIEKLIETLDKDIRGLCETATSNNIMRIDLTIRKFYLFLQRIHSPKANELQKHMKSAEDLLSKYVSEEGQSFDFEIPVEEMVKRWKAIQKWPLRLINITHNVVTNNDSFCFASRLSFEPEAKHHFIDDVSTNIPTDDYFTISHQQILSGVAAVGTGTLLGIIRTHDHLIDYLNLIASALFIVSKHLSIESEQLQQDGEMLSAMVQIIVNNKDMDKNAMAPAFPPDYNVVST